ncbi:MAG: chemotaxis protein CheB [Rhodocyclaceae bacterium]
MATRKTGKKAHGKAAIGDAASPGTAVQPAANARHMIVGIGASAGGLESFESFFSNVAPDCGMGFVLVPHLDPGHPSILSEILQRITSLPVVEARDQASVLPNHVYVIPPNRDMAILNGRLQLSVPDQPRGQRMPIDFFLRSLAEDRADKAVGIILSGTGTDGTLGLRAIQGAGGICLVQEPDTAKYDGMPQSVIESGYATHILPVETMPKLLLDIVQHRVSIPSPAAIQNPQVLSGLNQILILLRNGTGHDFSQYKKSTIGRRIERRMSLHNIDEIATYARYLKENPAEVHILFKELLINVTSFFRDPEAFVVLKQEILPQLLADKPDDYAFRVWVAGCASGEEAYSIAIVLRELMDEGRQGLKVQIYATDLDEDAIAVARTGRYLPNIAQDILPERLHRFFLKEDDGCYRVKKEIREMVIFAVQSVIKDPPFTRLDLLSCRNLMIYLEPAQQDRLILSFHYAIKPNGVLFLSASENVVQHSELFPPINRKWKFFRALHTLSSTRAMLAGDLVAWQAGKDSKAPEASVVAKPKSINFVELTLRLLVQSYVPPSVLTDLQGNILYVHGDTGRYLRPAPGQATLNIVDMAREGLQPVLRSAILTAVANAAPSTASMVSVKTNGGFSPVSFTLRNVSVPHSSQRLLLMTFQDVAEPLGAKRNKRSVAQDEDSPEARRTAELERELAYSRQSLQATIEEQQSTNEELKSTNEEMQSTNEELQSTNEELETSREELQSLNEELVTVNAELQAKIEQLSGMQSDMKNLLDNVNIATIFLDQQLKIRRFTRDALHIYRLQASDVGRPLNDINSWLTGDGLCARAQGVLDTLLPYENELQGTDGQSWLVRIKPYRTLDNVIDGVVMTFTDISQRIAAEAAVQLAGRFAESIVDTVREPLLVLDGDLNVVFASRAFFRDFMVSAEETLGRRLYDLGNSQWDIPALHTLLDDILLRDQAFDGYFVDHDFPRIGRRRVLLNARRIQGAAGEPRQILLAVEFAANGTASAEAA